MRELQHVLPQRCNVVSSLGNAFSQEMMNTILVFSRGQDGVQKGIILRRRNGWCWTNVCLASVFQSAADRGALPAAARPVTARLGLASGDDASDIKRRRKL